MSSEQLRYAKAAGILSERRNAAFEEQQLHENEIKKKVPEIIALQNELSQTSAKLAKIVLEHRDDGKKALAELRDRNLEAQELIRGLLKQNGYPEDYLQPHFTCPKCQDTGTVDGRRCDCLREQLRKIAVDELNDAAPLKLCDFSNFDLSFFSDQKDPVLGVVPRETMGKILAYCRKYAQSFSTDSPSILMLGPTGLGKTHLSLSIAKTAIEKCFRVLYCTAQDILRAVEREHFSKEGTGDETLQTVLDTDLLILDDLGAEFPTSFYASAIYQIVNSRLSSGRPTIINSNLSSKELEERYSERVVSRLLTQYTYLRFVGEDVRQLKRKLNQL